MPDDLEFDALLTAETSVTKLIVEPGTTEELDLPARELRAPHSEASVVDAVPTEDPAAPQEPQAVPPQTWSDARPALVLTGFDPNRATLRPAHIPLLLKLARQIVSTAANTSVARAIHLVGVSSPLHSSNSPAENRAHAVRAALSEAIDRMWPGLPSRIAWSTTSRPVHHSPRVNYAKSPAMRRAVEIFVEFGSPEAPIAAPVIVRQSRDKFSWNSGPGVPASPSSPGIAASPVNSLRALSSGGFFYVLSTDVAPARWVCSLEITLRAGENELSQAAHTPVLSATGLLISPRHVLTAAHCLFSRWREFNASHGESPNCALEDAIVRAESVVVSPGQNGESRPFGATTVGKPHLFRSSAHWRVSRGANPEFDYALITLKRPLQLQLEFWGRSPFHIRALPDGLSGAVVYSAGYPKRIGPSDESNLPLASPMTPGNSQWSTLGMVTNSSSRTFSHDLPFLPGQDGSPIWIQQDSERVLAGILTMAGQAVRITPRLLQRLKSWMAQDGVQPSF